MTLRVAFMGTPDFAVPSLVALHADPRVEVVQVISQPDRARGRGKKLASPPVVEKARALGLDIAQPPSMKAPEAIEAFAALELDLCVVAAYGQILRPAVLEAPRLGCINVHASLLPRWRGAAPIHRAIAAGDAVTGVSIMQMAEGLDTGDVWRMDAVMIGDEETAGELHDRLAELGATGLIEALDAIAHRRFEPTPQPNARSTYAKMLKPRDRRVAFDRAPADVAATINGMSPWPGAAVVVGDETLTLLRARVAPQADGGQLPGTVIAASAKAGFIVACESGSVEVLEVKRRGKRAMPARDALNGMSVRPGEMLTSLDA